VAKSELYGNPLIPIVLVAGILSGSLWRGTPPADTGKPGDSSSNGDKSDGASASVAWISDLRPVLESLDGALGARVGGAGALPVNDTTAVTLAAKGGARDQQIRDAILVCGPASIAFPARMNPPPVRMAQHSRVMPACSATGC
jgi:hypothetical protein